MEGVIDLMIVEFIGLPGAGKSKLASNIEVKSEEPLTKIKVIYPFKKIYAWPWLIRNLYKFFHSIVFLLKHPIKSWKLLLFILKFKQKNKIDYIRLFVNNTCFISFQNKYKKSKDVVIFDEGLVHHLWGIMANSYNKKLSREFLNFYEFPDLIIKVDVSEKTILYRNNKRKYSRRHSKILSDFPIEQKNIESLFVEVISYISNKNIIHSLSLENEKVRDLNRNINRINLQIEQQLKNLFERTE